MTNFTLNGIQWSIEEIDNYEKNSDNFGRCFFTESRIVIDKNISEDRKANTLLHELTHAILHEGGFEDLATNEVLVNALANGLSQIITYEVKAETTPNFNLRANHTRKYIKRNKEFLSSLKEAEDK